MIGRKAVREQIVTWVDRAIDVQDGAIRAHVAGVREGVPGGSAEGVAAALENQYLATVSGSGAVAGGAAAVPGLGTGLAVGLSVAETVAFLDATALFTLAVGETCGYPVPDLARRRALLLLALLGDEAVALVPPAPDGPAGWALRLAALPDAAVAEINQVAEKWLLTRFGPRQSLFVLGRLAPFGIGAAVGAAGNAVTAKGVIARVRTAYTGQVPAASAPVASLSAAADTTDGTTTDTTAAGDMAVATADTPDAAPAEASADTAADGVVADAAATPTASAVAAPSGKYAGLFRLLTSRDGDEVELRIDEIDAVVTGGLPATAGRAPAWWTNQAGPRATQASAWLAAGFHVAGADLERGVVLLRRGPVPEPVAATGA